MRAWDGLYWWHSGRALPLLCWEVQHPSGPPHFCLRSDTSFSSLSIRSRKAAKSTSHWPQPEPDPGNRRIRWVRTRGESGSKSISLSLAPSWTHESEITTLKGWDLRSLETRWAPVWIESWSRRRKGNTNAMFKGRNTSKINGWCFVCEREGILL